MLGDMPRYGFNFQWMFSKQEGGLPAHADAKALDFLAKHGFDFVRIPTDYRSWTEGTDYFHPNEAILAYLDRYLEETRSRGLHLSLNLHRAPGYCINRPEIETHNLWTDTVAQEAFTFLWTHFAERYKGVPNDFLSFDLLNEPPNDGERGFNRDIHQQIMRNTVAAIRAVDPAREIVLNGVSGGHLAIPELADLRVIHSGRGYQPMSVSHHGAHWWSPPGGWKQAEYPGEWDGKFWNRDSLRAFYQPWRDVEALGVAIHIGECGCYNQTPNDVAMRWLTDQFGIYREFGWGFGLWTFEGSFGIIEHGRPGAVYEELDGYQVDRPYLDLLLQSRIA